MDGGCLAIDLIDIGGTVVCGEPASEAVTVPVVRAAGGKKDVMMCPRHAAATRAAIEHAASEPTNPRG